MIKDLYHPYIVMILRILLVNLFEADDCAISYPQTALVPLVLSGVNNESTSLEAAT